MNMKMKPQESQRCSANRQTSENDILVDTTYSGAPIGELTPFPEELSPKYVLAQQQYKLQLKDKFRLLLAAGKEIINNGVADQQFGSIEPMSDDELKSMTTELDSHTDERTRHELIDALIPSQGVNSLSSAHTDQKYVRSLKMLNELVSALSREREKFDTYEELYVSDDKTVNSGEHAFSQDQLLGGMVDMLTVLSMFRNIKNKVNQQAIAEKAVEDSHYSLFSQMEKFLIEKRGTIEDKTLAKYRTSFNLLKELFPEDSDVRSWSKQQVQDVKTMLLQRKSNQGKNRTEKELSSTTRNMYLSNYRTLFTWIEDNTDADIKNPFANASFPKSSGNKKQPKRRSFKTEEGRILLSYEPMHGNEARGFRRDAKWYIKVCMYSSMRLNELSALPLSNIKPIDGIWCFDLRGLDLKNEASERVIPIAQYLLDEGILDYIKTLKKEKEKYFSPQIRKGITEPGSAGWGTPISKWFNRTVLKNIGINKDEELEKGSLICFHCTRRTFISTCVNNGEEKYLIKRLAGHSTDDDITLGVYSDVDQIDLKLLKNVIDRNLKWHLDDVH